MCHACPVEGLSFVSLWLWDCGIPWFPSMTAKCQTIHKETSSVLPKPRAAKKENTRDQHLPQFLRLNPSRVWLVNHILQGCNILCKARCEVVCFFFIHLASGEVDFHLNRSDRLSGDHILSFHFLLRLLLPFWTSSIIFHSFLIFIVNFATRSCYQIGEYWITTSTLSCF